MTIGAGSSRKATSRSTGSASAARRANCKAAPLQRQLTHRFSPLPPEATERLSGATIDELDAIGEHLLGAELLDEALGAR